MIFFFLYNTANTKFSLMKHISQSWQQLMYWYSLKLLSGYYECIKVEQKSVRYCATHIILCSWSSSSLLNCFRNWIKDCFKGFCVFLWFFLLSFALFCLSCFYWNLAYLMDWIFMTWKGTNILLLRFCFCR